MCRVPFGIDTAFEEFLEILLYEEPVFNGDGTDRCPEPRDATATLVDLLTFG